MSTRRRIVLWAGAIIAILAIAVVAIFQISNARCFVLSGEAICRVETREPIVALTFDDGPTPEGVAAAIAALRAYQAHATFFLIGDQLAGREALVRALLADGHEVGNHSFSHQRMIGRTSGFYDEEIVRTDELLRAAGVAHPDLFRPPYGKKLWGLPNILARRNYHMIMWDVEDPAGVDTPEAYAQRVVEQAQPGSLIFDACHVSIEPDCARSAAARPARPAGARLSRGHRGRAVASSAGRRLINAQWFAASAPSQATRRALIRSFQTGPSLGRAPVKFARAPPKTIV